MNSPKTLTIATTVGPKEVKVIRQVKICRLPGFVTHESFEIPGLFKVSCIKTGCAAGSGKTEEDAIEHATWALSSSAKRHKLTPAQEMKRVRTKAMAMIAQMTREKANA